MKQSKKKEMFYDEEFYENIIKENKIMVIDGSMSTPLENRGDNM